MLLSPNKQLSVSNCNRGAARLAYRIRAQHFVLRPGFDHEGIAVVTGQQKFAVERYGRRAVELRGHGHATALVNHLASLCAQAGQDAAVVTERLFPDQLAVEAVAIDAFRTEIGIDVFAVGDGGGSGVIAALMAVVVDAAFVRGLLPQYLPGVAVEAERLEGVELVHPVPIGMRELFIADYSLGRLVARGFGAAFDVSGQENFFGPDDRLRKSLTGDRRLPQNVLRHVPFSRRIFVVRNALGVRAAPLRPVG